MRDDQEAVNALRDLAQRLLMATNGPADLLGELFREMGGESEGRDLLYMSPDERRLHGQSYRSRLGLDADTFSLLLAAMAVVNRNGRKAQ